MSRHRIIPRIPGAGPLAVAGVAAALALFAPEARAEYGYFHHNGVLGGLGSPDDYVLVPDPNDVFLQPWFTIEAWVHPTAESHRMMIFSKGEEMYEFYLTEDGTPAVTIDMVDLLSDFTVPLDEWTHLAVSFEFIGDVYQLQFFKNGALEHSTQINSAWEPEPHDVTIGATLDDPDAFFEGFIDEVRWWNHARDAPQIAASRFVGLGDFPNANQGDAITLASTYQGLVASWNFNYLAFPFDFIGNHHGDYMGLTGPLPWKHPPIPYNQVLRLRGGPGDYVVVPDNPSKFNQGLGATIEMWVNPWEFSRSALFARGNDYALSTGDDGSVQFRLGTANVNAGPVLQTGQWSHVAATWAKIAEPSTYELSLYVNGVLKDQKTVDIPYPVAGGLVRIGHAPTYSLKPIDAFIDEVRFWHGARSQAEIQRSMFASGREQADEPLALWGFEGNLASAVDASVNGTFQTGLVNNSHFSAYRNESTPGPFGPNFEAHPTGLNTATNIAQVNEFPDEFAVATPFALIPANGQVVSQLFIPSAPNATGLEVFLSVRHPDVNNLRCTVKHKTIEYVLFDFNSTVGKHVLSFFANAHVDQPDDAIYPAPWGFLVPTTPLTALSTGVGGIATLVCKSQTLLGGTLQGWGIRSLP